MREDAVKYSAWEAQRGSYLIMKGLKKMGGAEEKENIIGWDKKLLNF